MAVYMELVEPIYKEAVIENIEADIRNRGYALTAGDIGYHYLVSALHEAGKDDVIYQMNNRTDVPGYGYQLAKGATSLTESWQALPTVSNNHFMLGHLMEWFYAGLGGIHQSESSIGFKNLIIDPRPVGDLKSASAKFNSPYGIISSEWKKEGNTFEITVEVPANTNATLYLPGSSTASTSENGKSLRTNPDVRNVGTGNGKLRVEIGSGKYHFKIVQETTND
jgi:alpha-L-rhamnosidase